MQVADVASTWYPVERLRSGRRYILTKDSIDDPHGMKDLCTCTWVMYHLHVHVHGTCTWYMYHEHVPAIWTTNQSVGGPDSWNTISPIIYVAPT